jgi:hypothetical protein
MNILLFILGLALLGLGVFLIIKNIKLSKNGVRMEAEIVEVMKRKETSTDSEGYTTTTDMYYPVIKYNFNGQEYIVDSNYGVSNKNKYKVGGMLNIIFMEDKPDKPKMKNFGSLWVGPILIVFVGVLLVIGAFVA